MKIYFNKSNWLLFLLCIGLMSCLATVAVGEPQNFEYKNEAPTPINYSLGGTIIKIFFSLTFIILLAVLMSRFFNKRMINLGQGKHILLLDHFALGHNRAVYIIEIAGEVLVIGAAENSMNLLSKIEDPAVIAALKEAGDEGTEIPLSFRNYFQSVRENIKKGENTDLSSSLFLQNQIERLKNISRRQKKESSSTWQKNSSELGKDDKYER